MFELLTQTTDGRRGRIHTRHGIVETPAFFPVGTAGAMRGFTLDTLRTLGSNILLCNTYHLHLQPGEKIVRQSGGLHSFIGWDGPILTDSGGFQVFSLRHISAIDDTGVRFRSHINGSMRFLGPEEAMRIQHALGADIIMCFDECPPSTASRAVHIRALDRTLRWAASCKKHHIALQEQRKKEQNEPSDGPAYPLLFGIVQGGLHMDLRKKCAEELIAIGFDGYAIGGLAVGEPEADMLEIVRQITPLLPADKPRYLMGVGKVSQHVAAVAAGIDIFDCVLPMREARHGRVLRMDGTVLRMKNSRYIGDSALIDASSTSPLSRHHTLGYLAHLFRVHERSAETIACMQNMAVTLESMRLLREKIERQ